MEKGDHHHKELQLLPHPPPPSPPPPPPPPPQTPASSTYQSFQWFPAQPSARPHTPLKAPAFDPQQQQHHQRPSSPDLQLSISLQPSCIETLKWQAAEHIRLAALEKAYAARVRELTRREMELAQAEFARARMVWDRAVEEEAEAEKMKDNATRQIGSSCLEITCHSCRQRFRP